MPWLVVLGNGSWGVTLDKEWHDDPHGRVWPDSPLDDSGAPKPGRWTYPSKTFKAGKHKVDNSTAAKAIGSGIEFLRVFEDEPEVDTSQPSGTLGIEDVRKGTPAGARVVEPEADAPPEAPADEEPVFEHRCLLCTRTFPSSAALERHHEWEHVNIASEEEEMRILAAAREDEEKEARRRMEDAKDKLPVWEREALGTPGVE
jgi:hypothetical protein